MCRHINHTESCDGIIPHRYGKRHNDDDKRKRLLTHAEYGSEQTEQDYNQGYHDIIHSNHPEKAIFLHLTRTTQER